MIKTKSTAYNLVAVIAATLLILISMAIGFYIVLSISAQLGYDARHDEITDIIGVALALLLYALILGIAYGLYRLTSRIFQSIFDCDIYECNSKSYADGFYVLRRNDQSREANLSNIKTGGPVKLPQRAYTVYVELSYRQLDMATYRMLNQFHSTCYEIPCSYIMPDGVSCLCRPKISLSAAMRAQQALREDETVFFIYHVAYPSRKSQLAHADQRGEVVIIEKNEE